MLKRMLGLSLAGLIVGLVGCPTEEPPPAASVLQGTWEAAGEAGAKATVTFNSSGQVTQLTGQTPTGTTVTLDITGSTSTVQDSNVTFSVPLPSGVTINFAGTVSNDDDTLTGDLSGEIVLQDGSVVVTVPGGEVTLQREGTQPPPECTEDDDCDPDEVCSNGACVPREPAPECTIDDDCEADEVCSNGACVPGEPAPECTTDDDCEADEVCTNGTCVPTGPAPECTTDDDCETCEACAEGECVPLTGDAAAGETFYADNNCAVCHGADGTGGAAGPSLEGVNCATFFEKLSGAVAHVGGTVDGVTEQDAADLEAWLATE